MRKSDYLRKKGVSERWQLCVCCLCEKTAVAHLLTALSPHPPCFHSNTLTHTRTTAQWASDTMWYTASAHLRDNPHTTCAKVDSLKTMLRHCSHHNQSAFKDIRLKDRRAAQCTNTAISHLYSQAMYFYQLLKPFPFRHSNNGAQLRETGGLYWYWALLNGRLTSIDCHSRWMERKRKCAFVCVCVRERENERTLGGDSRYLRPTDRHLALHQPSTTRPNGMLRNVTSWHWRYTACVYVAARTARTQCEHEPVKIVSKIRPALWLVFFFSLSLSTHTNINTHQ